MGRAQIGAHYEASIYGLVLRGGPVDCNAEQQRRIN